MFTPLPPPSPRPTLLSLPTVSVSLCLSQVGVEIDEAMVELNNVKERKAERLAALTEELEESQRECEQLEKEAEVTRRHLVALSEAAEKAQVHACPCLFVGMGGGGRRCVGPVCVLVKVWCQTLTHARMHTHTHTLEETEGGGRQESGSRGQDRRLQPQRPQGSRQG
jgi:hypothetical protein